MQIDAWNPETRSKSSGKNQAARSRRILPQPKDLGRVHPLLLGLVILVVGLLLKMWWWQLGAVLLIAVFVGAFYRYRAVD